MASIAEVASDFRRNMVSPTQRFAGSYKESLVRSDAAKAEKAKIEQQADQFRQQQDLSEKKYALDEKKTIDQMNRAEKAELAAKRAGAAYQANTPEKWAALQKHIPDVIPPEVTFDQRDVFLAQHMKAADMLGYQKAEETERHNRAMEAKKSGMSISMDPEGGFTFTSGDIPAPKGAQTGLFKDLVTGQQSQDSMTQIESLYEPEFLTYPGAAKGKWATFMNKMDPENRSKFQQRRAAFMSAADREFLTFRKWATGVAGGEKEMAEIKKVTFSSDDSPQDFEAKLQLAKSLRRRLNARTKAALASGVNNDKAFREFLKANPLDNIPTLQQRGEQLEQQGYSKEQVMQILINEGYIEPK